MASSCRRFGAQQRTAGAEKEKKEKTKIRQKSREMAKIQTQWEMCGSNFTADWKNIAHKHSTPAVFNMNNLSFLTLKTNIRKQHYFSLTL